MAAGHDDLKALIRQAAVGDDEAAAALVRRYLPSLRKALHGKLRPELRRRLDTEDVLQSTLTLVLRDLPKVEYRGAAAFENWLLTVALRHLTQTARFHRAARRDIEREEGPGGPPPAVSDATSPSEHAARQEMQRGLREGVAMLAPIPRRIVEMRGLEGLAFAEIAEQLELPSAEAARQRYLRALVSVRKALGHGEGEGGP